MDGRTLWQLITKTFTPDDKKDLTSQDAIRDTKISDDVLIKLRNRQYCFGSTEKYLYHLGLYT